jgi:hypothetical protein
MLNIPWLGPTNSSRHCRHNQHKSVLVLMAILSYTTLTKHAEYAWPDHVVCCLMPLPIQNMTLFEPHREAFHCFNSPSLTQFSGESAALSQVPA